MELDELRQMSAGDLRVKEREAREEVFRLRLKLRTNQLDNPRQLRTGAARAGADPDRCSAAEDKQCGGREGKRCASELNGAKAWWSRPR